MFVVPLAAAAFLTLTDAFGLDILPAGERFLYWLILLALGQIASLAIRFSLERLPVLQTQPVLAVTLQTVLMAMPLALAVWLVTAAVLPPPFHVAPLPQFYLPVLVVVAAMVAINLLVQRRPRETHAAAQGDGPKHAAILARLPPKLRAARLYAVQAEDHYIRFYTSAGSDLVLLRFADALGELEGIEGAQVHRSWWVAREAVESLRRDDGKLFLVLRDGTKAPVSRTFTRALREEGWF
jgi:hypothetical protein